MSSLRRIVLQGSLVSMMGVVYRLTPNKAEAEPAQFACSSPQWCHSNCYDLITIDQGCGSGGTGCVSTGCQWDQAICRPYGLWTISCGADET